MSNEDQKIESSPSGGSNSNNNKKKRNRNKKKSKNKESSSSNNNKKKGENEQQQSQNNNNNNNDGMNPHAVLRNDINSQGYSFDEIDKAMEEMWDKGLSYDEVDAVLKYLKTGGGGATGTEADSGGGGGGGTADEYDEKEEDDEMGTRATDDSTKYSEGENDGVEEEKSCGGEQDNATKPAPMTMIQKLDMVADFENMTDAVFALTEWVNKAAKPKDVS